MKAVRSWPDAVPPGRNYVVDNLPRLVMRDYSYRVLGDLDDDVLLIEWDLAIGREDFEHFVDLARAEPGRVLVAPYRIYQTTTGDDLFPQPFWVHRRYTDGTEQAMRFVTPDDATCHLWGLGLVYLPRQVISGFLSSWPGHASDASISGWHHRNVEQETRIAWDVRPVHLHYPIERIVSQ